MFNEISFYMIFGKPLIMYGGILTFLSFATTASIPVLNQKGITKIPVKWHIWMARISLILGVVHGLFGVLSFF